MAQGHGARFRRCHIIRTVSVTDVLPGEPGEPPFSRVGIFGLGLIGGSIALGARRTWPHITLVGFDRSREILDTARGKVVHETVTSLGGLASCDLIILAIPVNAIVELMPVLARVETRAVITDVGSTKRQVIAAARAAGVTSFVGGHPMGGSAHVGLEFARPDMFVTRPWLFVSQTATPPASASRLDRFARGCGATPHWFDAEAHDRAVAYVSHLPQLLSVALMNAASSSIAADGGLTAVGRAFTEMTRLASSPSGMWVDIIASNGDFVAEALKALVANLPSEADLRDGRWVRECFARAGSSRAKYGVRSEP